MHSLFRQISIYINGTLVSTSKNVSNCENYIQLILMTLGCYKKLRKLAIWYEYKTDSDTSNVLKEATTSDLHLVGKINHEISHIPKWMPLNDENWYKVTTCTVQPYFTKSTYLWTWCNILSHLEILHVQIQQDMSSVALVINKWVG